MITKKGAYQLPRTEVWQWDAGGVERSVFISVPKQAPPPDGFPVLIALDGNAVFASLTETVRLQTRPPHGYPPAMVVGIGYPIDEPFSRNDRFFDYTVKAERDERGPIKGDWPETGGVEAFLSIIEEELLPSLESAYALHPTKRALFGHSLGGLCVLHTLLTRDHLFETYIAGSPSIWWKKQYVKQVAQSFLGSEISKKLLICVGSNEKGHMLDDTKEMAQSLAEVPELDVSFMQIEGAGHIRVLQPLMTEAIRTFLATGEESVRL
ncbi:alpha/beta hydrolase [Bacillus sp. JCM 19041]|uniref:alpha/beta hydrolase n=1 Tax=Bacillus sp. JCM 19041 TaxID=1460637 RepID=UPI0006D013C1